MKNLLVITLVCVVQACYSVQSVPESELDAYERQPLVVPNAQCVREVVSEVTSVPNALLAEVPVYIKGANNPCGNPRVLGCYWNRQIWIADEPILGGSIHTVYSHELIHAASFFLTGDSDATHSSVAFNNASRVDSCTRNPDNDSYVCQAENLVKEKCIF